MYSYEKLPYGLRTASGELVYRFHCLMNEFRQEAENEAFGGRPIEEDRW